MVESVDGILCVDNAHLVGVVNKAAPLSVGAGTGSVKCAAYFGLILRMTEHISHFMFAMRKLASGTVAALSSFEPVATQFSLVQVLFV